MFQKSPTRAGTGRSLLCDGFGISDLAFSATVAFYLVSQERAEYWTGSFRDVRERSTFLETPVVLRLPSPILKVYQLIGLRVRIWEALERQTAEGQHELRIWDFSVR